MSEATPPAGVSPAAAPVAAPGARLVSLDAFRGAVILLMASSGLGLAEIAKRFPDHAGWRFLGTQCEHAAWAGGTLWDLIQPAFLFMAGVALPWSLGKRLASGERFSTLFRHVLLRSGMLVLLAVFLSSAWSRQTEWVFTNVLAQIGLGYPFLFLLALLRPRSAWLAAAGVLLGTWLAFALYPLPAADFDWRAAGFPEDWPRLTGFSAHWEKHVNAAAAFDRWFLNLFPRGAPFTRQSGGYQTLNFIPSLATMIFGLQAGRLLRGENRPLPAKIRRLALAGAAGVALGLVLDAAGLCPMVKRIWTPSWTLFSGGMSALILAAFVSVVDLAGWRRPVFPLVVAGLNPITLYVLWQLSGGFIRQQLRIHLGSGFFAAFGETWIPLMERAAVLLVLWLTVWWMWRRRIFLRI